MQEETIEKDNGTEVSEEEINSPEANADKTVRHHVYVSLGIGLIPIPFVDFIGVTGAQFNMMRKLALIYNIPFSKDMVKNLIGALIGGAFPASIGPRIASSVSKTVPGVGQALGAVSASVVSGACTYAVGKVFSRHFAEGGTLLSFDPEPARAFYEEMFSKGQEVVSELKTQKEKK